MSAIGIVLLAAGGSTRLGSPKQLLQYEGRSLLRRAAETAAASSCRPIIVVLGAQAALCAQELHGLPVSAVENTDWAEGMGSSLRLGVKTLLAASPLPLDAVLVMLCDQPLLTVATLKALTAEYEATACRIVASEYGTILGVPALFDRSLFPPLLSLSRTQGAKQILHLHPDLIHKVAFAEGAVDIDTATDYARLSLLPVKNETAGG